MKPIPTWDTQYVGGGILTMASHMQQEIDALRERVAELESEIIKQAVEVIGIKNDYEREFKLRDIGGHPV